MPLEAHLAVPQGTFPTNVCVRGAAKRGASETVFQERVFDEIWYLTFIRKSVGKIQVSLKSDKNNGYFAWTPIYIYDNISLSSS